MNLVVFLGLRSILRVKVFDALMEGANNWGHFMSITQSHSSAYNIQKTLRKG